MNTVTIPRHPLRNKAGHQVRFDIQDWGEAATYDFLKAHRHSFCEILVFEKGKAQHDIDFSLFSAGPKQVHFVASDSVHLLVREADSKGYSILFTPDYFDSDLLAALPFTTTTPFLKLSNVDFKTFRDTVLLIRKEIDNQGLLSEKIVHNLACSLMLLLARLSSQQAVQLQSSQSEYIQQFKRLIKEHYKQHYKVEQYAELLHISAKHLIACCKSDTGKTPLKHIHEQVTGEAKRLFYYTRMTVKEVAYALNFDTPAGFSKYFKSVTGHSPSVYRREERMYL